MGNTSSKKRNTASAPAKIFDRAVPVTDLVVDLQNWEKGMLPNLQPWSLFPLEILYLIFDYLTLSDLAK